MSSVNFKEINQRLLQFIAQIVTDVAPGGKRRGNEYVAGDINGGPGDSFSVNLLTGAWADFANPDLKGGDIISLWAKSQNMSQPDAAFELEQKYLTTLPINYPSKPAVAKPRIIKPPPNAAAPGMYRFNMNPTQFWTYRDMDGSVLFYVARYDLPDGDKQYLPFTYEETGKWVNRHYPKPWPLYNLDQLAKYPDKRIMLVEGEKAADAIPRLTKHYIPMTWPGGSQNFSKADFSPIFSRQVVLWPDADESGRKAMSTIAAKLVNYSPEIKYIETDRTDGWDAADAAEEPDFKLVAWASNITVQFTKPKQIDEIPKPREIGSDKPFTPDEGRIPRDKVAIVRNIGLQVTDKDKIIMNMANVTKLLSSVEDFAGKIFLDEFRMKVYSTLWSKEATPWTDGNTISLLYLLQSQWGFEKITRNIVDDAVTEMAHRFKKNPLKDWIKSLIWDKTPRIRSFFPQYMGTENNEYTQAVGQNFFVAMVARIFEPGCKMDNMIILEGPQGSFKSTSLKILAGEYFAEAPSALDNKDFEQTLVGRMIVEFGELDQFRKTASTLIKKKLSCAVDTYRPSYGRHALDVLRTCVFVGTTNKDDYLQDETGARRFWPIKTNLCDIKKITADREQLFAEAYSLYLDGAKWHEVPEMAKDEQEKRRDSDPWEEVIAIWIENNPYEKNNLTSAKIWIECLSGDIANLDHSTKKQIAKCMKALGYKSDRPTINKIRTRAWVKDEIML